MMETKEAAPPILPKNVIVIGGGIAGLAAAYYLKKHGVRVKLFERNSLVGGCIRTVLKEERYLLEYGPNSFLSSATAFVRLMRELSLDPQVVTSETGKRRYVYRRGRLHLFPTTPKALATSGLLSLRGKGRLMMERWVKSKGEESESLASFVRRRGGAEILDAMVDPFVSGIFAGDPVQLEVQSIFPKLVALEQEHGSILKGLRKSKQKQIDHDLLSFRWGMGTLPARLEELLRREIELTKTVESIERLPNGRLCVRLEAPRRTFEADAVILATPAWMTARLISPLLPDAISEFMAIPYTSVAVVHTAFPKSAVSHRLDGFGFLSPRSAGLRMLGSIWSSSLFSGRAPQNEVLLTNFLGGATDSAALELEDHELVAHVTEGLERVLGITADPGFVHVRRVSQAIPQYTIGHRSRMARLQRGIEQQPGIFLVGNYLAGISVSETIEHVRSVVDHVLDQLGVWKPGATGARRGDR